MTDRIPAFLLQSGECQSLDRRYSASVYPRLIPAIFKVTCVTVTTVSFATFGIYIHGRTYIDLEFFWGIWPLRKESEKRVRLS